MNDVEGHLAALRAGRVVRLPLSPTRVIGQTLLIGLACAIGAAFGLGLLLDGRDRGDLTLGRILFGGALVLGGACLFLLFALIAVSRLRGREELVLLPTGLVEVSRTGRESWLPWSEIEEVEIVRVARLWPVRPAPYVVCRTTRPGTRWLGRDYAVRREDLVELLRGARQ